MDADGNITSTIKGDQGERMKDPIEGDQGERMKDPIDDEDYALYMFEQKLAKFERKKERKKSQQRQRNFFNKGKIYHD